LTHILHTSFMDDPSPKGVENLNSGDSRKGEVLTVEWKNEEKMDSKCGDDETGKVK